ncbi:S49 family peptidase [Oscillatoria sp. CS-180]|uniref:S49 family peptidase n=1 Tax=Oscillatoria sp. CS-180 TaxID=3021720 RepID=UPI00232DF801|nr:S49 family peptidase [Oscillatoria sp. CS-180]MDB9525172.1 S49 family peptidase [Oscillatoria sp. CS-180]
MKRFVRWLAVLSGLSAIGFGAIACVPGIPKSSNRVDDDALEFEYIDGDENSDNYLLEIRINGPILNTPSNAGFFGLDTSVTYAYQLQELLEEVAEDERINGLFLRLSTPGGTVVGSNVVYEALVDYKEATENPIYAYVEGLSASGGVWAMVAADQILAAPGSIVGSIGVIGPSLIYFNNPIAIDGGILGGGVTTQGGIQQFVVSAGKGKDLGNPFRQPTEEELQVLRENINNEYDNFVSHVSETRGIPEQTIREDMGAYIFGTEQAKQYQLIDDTMGRPEAIAALAESLELEDYQLVAVGFDAPGLLEVLLGRTPINLTYEQQEDIIQQDLCNLANYSFLAYYGDVLALCPQP